MNPAFKKANQLAKVVFKHFMQEVVETHVLEERTRSLSKEDKIALEKDKITNINPIYLMSISGKGGFDGDPEKFARYSKNFNITLLDHLLSVTRGAILLAAIDWLSQDPKMDEEYLTERLTVLAAIAFLHDLDKMLQLPRNEPLSVAHVEQALTRYGITGFLGDIHLTPEQIRFLIEHVEPSQQHRHPCANEPKREYKQDAKRYIQLADKLDGLWCQYGSKAGLEAIIQRLHDDFSTESDILSQWHSIDIYDPHHPFLLDELQRELSHACTRIAGIPPLLETHQGGRLFMLLPKQQATEIKEKALTRLLNKVLPFNLELIISNRGLPELRNDKPDYPDLVQFLTALDHREMGKLFKVSNSLIDTLTTPMSQSFANVGLEPRWQTKRVGQTSSPYTDPLELTPIGQQALLKAAEVTLLLNLKLPITTKNGLPSYEEREQQLLEHIEQPLPEWLATLEDAQARRVLLGVWCVSLVQDSPEIEEKIWGSTGLLKAWLEGSGEQTGFNQFFAGEGIDVIAEVKQHFNQLLSKARVTPIDEKASGRCLFTDAPAQTLITSSLNLYEVKVSAFTGREGKPDSITAPSKGVVPISYIALAEHKLRQEAFDIQKGKPAGVPTLVSSPMTTGLFGALVLSEEKHFPALSSYDVNRKKNEKGKVNFKGLELYKNRYRIARLERIPEKTEDQINTLRLLLQTCLRIGRPLHLFRGLPTSQKAFFYFDAMPRVLKQLVGSNELRLEQIPQAITILDIAHQIASTAGLGYEVMMLYAMPQTRFGACALVWCYAQDHLDDPKKSAAMRHLQHHMIQSIQFQQEKFMNEQDGALVRLGQAATTIQKYPSKGSRSEEMLVFTLCFNFLKDAVSGNQTDQSSLINGLADTLAYNLLRKDKTSEYFKRRKDLLDESCLKFSEQFTQEIWQQVLQQKLPAQKQYRLLSSIYRMSFIQAYRQKKSTEKAEA